MEFTTRMAIPESLSKIDYTSQILSLGSCFAVNMASKFKDFQFPILVNPLGIVFHPWALEKLINYALSDYVFSEKDVFCHREVWSCFDVHSELNQLDQADLIELLNNRLELLKQALLTSSHIVITVGTSCVYKNLITDQIVANCHKVPQREFEKILLTVAQIEASFEQLQTRIHQWNPKAQLIFTISPVRHLKDGFVENQRSKSHLVAALHQFLENNPKANAHYFPAYELVMDELRDYRFYGADLLHPTDVAIDYIWQRWVQAWIALPCVEVMQKVLDVQRGLNHRSFNPTSKQHGIFLEQLAVKIDYLLDRYPFMNFR